MFTGQVMGGTVPKGTGKSCLIRSAPWLQNCNSRDRNSKGTRMRAGAAGRRPKRGEMAKGPRAGDAHSRGDRAEPKARIATNRLRPPPKTICRSAPSTIGAVEGRRDPPVSTIDDRRGRGSARSACQHHRRTVASPGRQRGKVAITWRAPSRHRGGCAPGQFPCQPDKLGPDRVLDVLDGPLGVDRPDFNAFRALIRIGKLAVGGRKP